MTPTAALQERSKAAQRQLVEPELDHLAVLPLINKTSKHVTQNEVDLLTEVVRNAAQKLPVDRFLVMRNENITVLLPPGVDLERCVGECEVETGRLIGAHWLVTGSVVRFGSSLRVTLSLFDTRKAQQLASNITKGVNVEDLEASLKRDTLKILSKLEPSIFVPSRFASSAVDEPAVEIPKGGFEPIDKLPGDQSDLKAALERFQVSPPPRSGKSFDSLENLDVLTAYDKALKADADPGVDVLERARLWRALAEISPAQRSQAIRRAEAWEEVAQKAEEETTQQLNDLDDRRDLLASRMNELVKVHEQLQTRERAQRERLAEAWLKLERLLSLSDVVIPPSEKMEWVEAFVREFDVSPEKNPHLKEPSLRPYLMTAEMRGVLREAQEQSARQRALQEEQMNLLRQRQRELTTHLKTTERLVEERLKATSINEEEPFEVRAGALHVGMKVKVKPSVKTPEYGWGSVSHSSVGEITRIDDDKVKVDFDDQSDWSAAPDELMPLSPSQSSQGFMLTVGMKVKVKPSVKTPEYGWGSVSHSSVGEITRIDDDKVKVDFDDQADWSAHPSELMPLSSYALSVDQRGREIRAWLEENEDSSSAPSLLSLSSSPRLVELLSTAAHSSASAAPRSDESEDHSTARLTGQRVRRGPDWKWGEQDGGEGRLGTLLSEVDDDGWVKVKWDEGGENTYRLNSTHQDLTLISARSTSAPSSLRSGALFKALEEGVSVRIKKSISRPRFGWGDVSHHSIGVVRDLSRSGQVSINFEEDSSWSGARDELDVLTISEEGSIDHVVQRLKSAAGVWAENVDVSKAKPQYYSGYYMLVEGSEEYIQYGSILQGARWDNSSSPKFQTVHGKSKSDGAWYVKLAHVTYLGPQWRDEWVSWSERFTQRYGGSSREMSSFSKGAPQPSPRDSGYEDYVKRHLKPMMRVRAVRSHEAVRAGELGTYYGATPGNPPCFVLWDRDLGTNVSWFEGAPVSKRSHGYWMYWRDLEIISR